MKTPATRLHQSLRDGHFYTKYPLHAALLSRLEVVDDGSVDWLAVSLVRGKYYLHINEANMSQNPVFLQGIVLHELQHVALGHLASSEFRADDVLEGVMDLCLEMSANEGIIEPLPSPITWQQYTQFGIRARQSARERYAILEPIRSAHASATFFKPGGASSLDDHSRWSHCDKPSAGTLANTRELMAQCIREAETQQPEPRIAGLTPGKLLENLGSLKDHTRRSTVDWRVALQALVHQVREPRRDWARPNRRFAARVGEIPGRVRRSAESNRVELMVVIDTSSSVSHAELAEVSAQLAEIAQTAAVTVVECDASVHRVYPYSGALRTVFGRGGTDFNPVFQERFLKQNPCDAIVYFTDGEGDFPKVAPKVPVLWVLTRGDEFVCPWGERVYLNYC